MTQSTLPPLAAQLLAQGQLADRIYEENAKQPQQRLVLKQLCWEASLRATSFPWRLLFSWGSHPEPRLSCATAMHAIDPDPGHQTNSPAWPQACLIITDLPGNHWCSSLHPDLTLALTYCSSKSVRVKPQHRHLQQAPLLSFLLALQAQHTRSHTHTHTACSNKAPPSFSNSAPRAHLKGGINSGPHFLYSLPCISTSAEDWHTV